MTAKRRTAIDSSFRCRASSRPFSFLFLFFLFFPFFPASLGERTRVVRKRTPTHGPINRPDNGRRFLSLRLTHFDNRRGESCPLLSLSLSPPRGSAGARWKPACSRVGISFTSAKLSGVSEIDVAPGGSSMGTLFKQRTLRAPCKCKRPLLPDLVVSRMNVSTG